MSRLWITIIALQAIYLALAATVSPAFADDGFGDTKPTTAPEPVQSMHARLLDMAKRLVDVAKATPDTAVQKIIGDNHLDDADALSRLSEDQSVATVNAIAVALNQAAGQKDATAAQLMHDFQIKSTSTGDTDPDVP